jgi:hypothetical protein
MTRPLDHTSELASPSEPNSAAPLLQLASDERRAPTAILSSQAALIACLKSPIISANWETPETKWTVPIGGGCRAGDQDRHNLSLSAYYNLVKPQFGADWQLRPQVMLIF